MNGILERVIFEFGDSIIVAIVSIGAMIYSNSMNRRAKYSDTILEKADLFYTEVSRIKAILDNKASQFIAPDHTSFVSDELDAIIEDTGKIASVQTMFLGLRTFGKYHKYVIFLVSKLRLQDEARLEIINDREIEEVEGYHNLIIYPGTFNLYTEEFEDCFREMEYELRNLVAQHRFRSLPIRISNLFKHIRRSIKKIQRNRKRRQLHRKRKQRRSI